MKNVNSGYIGYSLSVRAVEAYDNDYLPKTKFKKQFSISEKKFVEFLSDTENYYEEWHHTSKFFNKTFFYKPTEQGLCWLVENTSSENAAHLLDRCVFEHLNTQEEVEAVRFKFEYEYPKRYSWTGICNEFGYRSSFFMNIDACIRWAEKNPILNIRSSYYKFLQENLEIINIFLDKKYEF
jgi:hypothetical protein